MAFPVKFPAITRYHGKRFLNLFIFASPSLQSVSARVCKVCSLFYECHFENKIIFLIMCSSCLDLRVSIKLLLKFPPKRKHVSVWISWPLAVRLHAAGLAGPRRTNRNPAPQNQSKFNHIPLSLCISPCRPPTTGVSPCWQTESCPPPHTAPTRCVHCGMQRYPKKKPNPSKNFARNHKSHKPIKSISMIQSGTPSFGGPQRKNHN